MTIEDVLNARFDKLDDKFESMRRELLASFVLKAVFEVELQVRAKEFTDLKKDFEEHAALELGKTQRLLILWGSAAGGISTGLYILHSLGILH